MRQHVHDNEIFDDVDVVEVVEVEDEDEQRDVDEHHHHIDEIDEIEYIMIFPDSVLYIRLDDDDECKITEVWDEFLNDEVLDDVIVSDAQLLVIEVDDDEEGVIQVIFVVSDEIDVNEYSI